MKRTSLEATYHEGALWLSEPLGLPENTRVRIATGEWFPLYVDAAALRWTPLFSMYVQAVALILFGKSLLVTRTTSVVVSLLAAGAVGLTLKEVFKARFWWAGTLLIGAIPAWLL